MRVRINEFKNESSILEAVEDKILSVEYSWVTADTKMFRIRFKDSTVLRFYVSDGSPEFKEKYLESPQGMPLMYQGNRPLRLTYAYQTYYILKDWAYPSIEKWFQRLRDVIDVSFVDLDLEE